MTDRLTAAHAFVKALEHEGIEYCFAVPGEENLDVLEALRTSSIKLITTRHEQSAAFMAATIGRLTGKPGVVMTTLGPGATNLVTAAAYATLGAMPLFMVTGQKPIKISKQGHFQIISVVDIMKPVTKYTRQIVSAPSIPSRVREAFRVAMEERPGAVHLELPEDIAAEEVGELPLFPNGKIRRPAAEEKAVFEAVRMIREAKRPLIVIGAGANRKLVSKSLREFTDKTGIPFCSTQMGKGVVDERHPLSLGCTALSSGDFVHRAIALSDCIINVGHDVVEKPPFLMKHDGAKVIHVNFNSAAVDDVYFPHWEVVGDIGNAIWQMTQTLEPQKAWDFIGMVKEKEKLEAHILRDSEASDFPIRPSRFVADIRKAVPENGIVCLDNGMYKLWFARQYKAYECQTLLLDNALATMGAGLPSGMGAKVAFPDKPVVVVAGDGGFLMNVHELETAVRLQMNLTIVILRDDGYGMIQWKQEASDFPSFGLEFGNPDMVQLAESFGAKAYRISTTDEFLPRLQACIAAPGVHVIDVPIDYADNVRVLTKELKELVS
jgi:acetolactate synthase-1/2/3 large subunit